MKKTKRIVGVTALLLAALMLFSSCAITYRKADSAKYVSISNGFDFKNFKLTTEIDKMVVTDEDVEEYINKQLFGYREAKLMGNGKPDVNQPGEYANYDILTIRTVLYDKDGNLMQEKNDFVLGSKASTEDDGTIVLGSEQSLYLGYGIGINEGLMASLEDKLFLHPEDAYLAQNQLVEYNNVGGVTAGALGAMPAVGYLTYEAKYYSNEDSTSTSVAKTSGTVAPMHFDRIGEVLSDDGKNSYEEILYIGLKELIERQAKIEKKQITPSTTKELTITVYPVADGVPEDAVFDATNTAIAYDMDFEKQETNYRKGIVTVKLHGTVDFSSAAKVPSAFITTYTYPEDASGTYTVKVGGKSETKDLAGTECTVYTYVIERAPYDRPAYNAETIKSKDYLGFETDKTGEDEVKAAYETSIRERLQKACDALAEEAVKKALLAQIMANTTLVKDPVRNIKNYVNSVINQARDEYISGGYRDKTNANGEYLYDDFEDYLTTSYTHKKDAEGNTIRFESLKAIKDDLYAEGRELVKENMLIYYLADQLGCRIDNDTLLAMAKERGAVWAKEQIEAGRAYIEAMYTVENLKKTYPDTLAASTDTMTKKEQLFETWGADSYEDCLAKQLAYYGEMYGETFESGKDYAKAAYPDDAYDWKDYVEAKQGKENLYGIYHAEVVLAKLLELNAANVAQSYKEIPFDAGLVELK